MRAFLLALTVVTLTACSTTNTSTENSPSFKAPIYPPVSVFYKQFSSELQQECAEFQQQSVLHHCNANTFDLSALTTQLSRAGAFHNVTVADADQEYQILTSIAVLDQESGAEIGNAALSGATLMMLPIVLDKLIKAEVAVTWRELPVKVFHYEIPFRHSASLFSGLDTYDENLTSLVADQFMQDLEKENVFSGRYLLSALNASDYENDLQVPQEIGDYYFDEKQINNNPFEGVSLHFLHKEFFFDRADVFIYPIANTEWSDAAEITQRETFNARNELDILVREGQLRGIDLQDTRELRWKIDGQEFPGTVFSGLITSNEGEQLRMATYIFTKRDKYLRVRASFPVTEDEVEPKSPDDFVRLVLQQLNPPEESLFMAKLRHKRRQVALTQ